MRYLCILTILLFLSIHTQYVEAFDIKVEPDISITENYVSDKNMYLIGARTWFNSTHQKDLISIALDQVIDGSVFGDALLIGNKISIEGELFDDVRIAANEVRISGITNKDLVVVARTVFIEDAAILNGENLILANVIYLDGQILGQSQITANTIEVTGSILSNTILTGQKISFKKGTDIVSSISYFSPQRATVEDGLDIKEKINFNQIESISENDMFKRLFFGLVSFWVIIKLIATLFMIFILTHLFRMFSQRVMEIVYENKFYTLLIGMISVIVIPVSIIILIGSLILIPIGIILSFIFGIMIISLPAMSAIILSSLYQVYVLKKTKVNIEFNSAAFALVGLTIIGFLPVLGSFIVYLFYILSFGALSIYIYENIRRKKIKI